jgi:hypothetical protein
MTPTMARGDRVRGIPALREDVLEDVVDEPHLAAVVPLGVAVRGVDHDAARRNSPS